MTRTTLVVGVVSAAVAVTAVGCGDEADAPEAKAAKMGNPPTPATTLKVGTADAADRNAAATEAAVHALAVERYGSYPH